MCHFALFHKEVVFSTYEIKEDYSFKVINNLNSNYLWNKVNAFKMEKYFGILGNYVYTDNITAKMLKQLFEK